MKFGLNFKWPITNHTQSNINFICSCISVSKWPFTMGSASLWDQKKVHILIIFFSNIWLNKEQLMFCFKLHGRTDTWFIYTQPNYSEYWSQCVGKSNILLYDAFFFSSFLLKCHNHLFLHSQNIHLFLFKSYLS